MQVLRDLERYIDQTLGLRADTDPWDKEKGLPFFLRDAYDFHLLHMQGRDYLLMVDRQKEEAAPATVRKHMELLRKTWADEVIYVREQVTSYNRTRLIQGKVPFIVPGNQLYLPALAIDLREHFIAQRTELKKLSPAAQVLVLFSIYEHRALFDDGVTMTDWAEQLGYTKMTMTRAFRELRAILDDEEQLDMIRGRVLWDRLLPYLRNPVRRRCYYDFGELEEPLFLAGGSALARYTMMAETSHKVICMEAERWKKGHEQIASMEIPRGEPGALEVEVWRYDPGRFARNGVADPLSVYLSYEKNADERIEMALEELLEDVQW